MTGASQLVGELLSAAIGDPHTAMAAWPPRHDTGVDFESLERRLSTGFDALAGFRYPPVLVELYSYVLPHIDCGLIRLMASAESDPLRELHEASLVWGSPDRVAGAGFVAIADDGNDGGPLCLDVRSGRVASMAPIVLVDHETFEPSAVLYDDADSLVRCAAHLLRGGRVADLESLGGSGAAREFAFWDES